MEAERLIALGRQALAGSGTAQDIVAEAWQAQALAQAIGSQLALCGPQELRGEARGLSEIGEYPAWGAAGPRAAQLTEVMDPWGALTALGELLGEVGIALASSGAHLLGCAALDDAGTPRYSVPVARQLVAAGMPVAALSPLALARWVGDRLRGESR